MTTEIYTWHRKHQFWGEFKNRIPSTVWVEIFQGVKKVVFITEEFLLFRHETKGNQNRKNGYTRSSRDIPYT